jgi:hypothetical protein
VAAGDDAQARLARQVACPGLGREELERLLVEAAFHEGTLKGQKLTK